MSDNPKLNSIAIRIFSQVPLRTINETRCELILKHLSQFLADDGITKRKLEGINMLARILLRPKLVQVIVNNKMFDTLPTVLFSTLKRAVSTGEIDVTIQILICLLRAVSYKYLRKQLLKVSGLTAYLIEQFLYTVDIARDQGVPQQPYQVAQQCLLSHKKNNASNDKLVDAI